MISPESLLACFQERGISFFTGVPDSLLKDFGSVLTALPHENHIIAANEGGAVGLAIGYHLATGKVPVAYMQNSGLGNSVNPLLSLADKRVYSVPMILLIGWRGEPGAKDEPQHLSQGEATTTILEAMGIPWRPLGVSVDQVAETVAWAMSIAETCSQAVAILVSKGAFHKSLGSEKAKDFPKKGLTRERAIEIVLENLNPDDVIVSSTGMISRELFEITSQSASKQLPTYFMTIGGMGHASQIALGISLNSTRRVVCLDGDGAALMHLGGMATIGTIRGFNLAHIVLNNEVHDSVGGQPTAAAKMSLTKVAESCGYGIVAPRATSEAEFRDSLLSILHGDGARFLEVKVLPGHRSNLGRPSQTPGQSKIDFMQSLSSKLARVGPNNIEM